MPLKKAVHTKKKNPFLAADFNTTNTTPSINFPLSVSVALTLQIPFLPFSNTSFQLNSMLGILTLNSPSSLTFQFRRRRRMFVAAAVAEAALDSRSLYEVLRVKRNASQIEIKTAYRTLAKLYHPDATSRFLDSSVASSPTDGRDFIEIHNAYATLSDPDARAVYDFSLNRRWNTAGLPGLRSPGRMGFCPTRRWETDQCW